MKESGSIIDRNLYVVQLTSLRGIACMVVLIGHAIQVINYHYQSSGFIADTFRQAVTGGVNAEGAVLVFFVLSGCVLSLSLRNVKTFNFLTVFAFYVRRGFRLYPLLWTSLILAAASMVVTKNLASAGVFSDWLAGNVLSGISLKHTLLSLTGLYIRYNGPMWSLRVELIYSALFPAIYLLMKHTQYRKWTIAFLIILALLPIPWNFGAAFGLAFAAGALLPMLPFRLSRFDVPLAFGALIVLMYDRLVLGGLNPPERIFDLIETAAAFVIVRDVYACGSRYNFLLSRPIVLLGEFSFSIYLLHLPVFLIIFTYAQYYLGLAYLLSHPGISQVGFSLVTALVTIFLSVFTYRLIELPMHRLGRKLAKQIAASAN